MKKATRTQKFVAAATIAIGAVVPFAGAASAAVTPKPAALQQTVTSASYRVAQVNSFVQLKGLASWVPAARDRFATSTWTFRSDGTFTYAPTNSRADLFPLSGRYVVSGSVVSFSASKTVQVGSTGSAGAAVKGTLTSTAAGFVVSFVQTSGSGNVAVVNNTTFSGSTSAAYQASGRLARI